MFVSDETCATMTKLVELGYAITNIYADGAVRMALPSGVSVFVSERGSVTPPMIHETRIEQARLHGEGITIEFGPKRERLSEFLGYGKRGEVEARLK